MEQARNTYYTTNGGIAKNNITRRPKDRSTKKVSYQSNMSAHQNSDKVRHANFPKCEDQRNTTSSISTLRAQRPRKKQKSGTLGLGSPNGQTAVSAPAPTPALTNSPIPSTEFKKPLAPINKGCAKKIQKIPFNASTEKTEGLKTSFDAKVTRLDQVLEKIQNIHRHVENRGMAPELAVKSVQGLKIKLGTQQHLPFNIENFHPMLNHQDTQQRKNSNNEQNYAEISNKRRHTQKQDFVSLRSNFASLYKS